MSTKSLRGYEYICTFINDFSKKTWIYFLKTKDEVFNCFQQFKALVENATYKNIQTLWLDNIGEYISKEYQEFCTRVGIRREWMVPSDLQHNGVINRKILYISKATRAILYD